MQEIADYLNHKYGEGTFVLTISDSYRNMKEMVQPHMHLIDNAKKAFAQCGVEAQTVPIRGGTDGARLSTWVCLVRTYPPAVTTSTVALNIFQSKRWTRW